MFLAIYARSPEISPTCKDSSNPDELLQLRNWAEREGHQVYREYVEPPVSAGQKQGRSAFRQMVADASAESPAFQIIAVHHRSRVSREYAELESLQRTLSQNGVQIASISETVIDHPRDLLLKVIEMFDSDQRKRNSHNVHRAVCRNARQGFSNGSRALFGFKVVSSDVAGIRGRKRKRLEIDVIEAEVVREIFRLYLHGLDGKMMGVEEIVDHLNTSGQSKRGRVWTSKTLNDILTRRDYCGERYFNVTDRTTGCARPTSEWIGLETPLIIDVETFEKTNAKHDRDVNEESLRKSR